MDINYIIAVSTKIRLVITIIGLLGNIAAFIIFSRKRFQTNSMGIYCRALAITDSLIIFLQTTGDFATVFFNINLYPLTTISCKLSTFFFVIGPPTSSWILVLLSLDKTIQITFPNR